MLLGERNVGTRRAVRRRIDLAVTALAILAGCGPGSAAAAMRAVRVLGPVRIDAHLDEHPWHSEPATRFAGALPVPGRPASQRTEFWLAYDDSHIYLAFRCHDTDADRIRGRATRRDGAFDDDWVAVFFSPGEMAAGTVELFVNPEGVQMDALHTGQGDDVSVDFEFTAAARRYDDGWIAELAVPFTSLVPGGDAAPSMRIIAVRQIGRSGEMVLCPPLDVSRQDWLTSGPLIRFEGVAGRRRLELLPAWTAAQRTGAAPRVARASLGCDLKCDLTRDLTLDVTWRPDFGQVEANAAQVEVNRRFPVNYPEKRPFFLEGRGIFRLAAEGHPVGEAFHSRTVQSPRWGALVTGNPSARLSLAALFVSDEVGGLARWSLPDQAGWCGAQIAVARGRLALGENRLVGAFASNLETGGAHNRAGGLDADLLLTPHCRLALHALVSHTRERKVPAEQGCAGLASAAAVTLRGRHHRLGVTYGCADPGFRLACGYVSQSDLHDLCVDYGATLHPPLRWLHRVTPRLVTWRSTTWAGEPTELGADIRLDLALAGGSHLQGTRTVVREHFAGRWFRRAGWQLAAASRAVGGLDLACACSRAAAIYYDPRSPRQGMRREVSASIEISPVSALSCELKVQHERFRLPAARDDLYVVTLLRGCLECRPVRSVYVRAWGEWNSAARELVTDGLISLSTRWGAILHLGHGSLLRDTAGGGASEQALFVKVAYRVRI